MLLSTLWRYAVHERLIRADLADEAVKLITRRLTPGLVGYVVMILLGLFLPIVAVLGYLIIAVYNLIPCSRPAAPRPGCSLRLSFHLNWVMLSLSRRLRSRSADLSHAGIRNS